MSIVKPFLWFASEAEEAANLYVSLFREFGHTAEIGATARYGRAGPGPEGSVMTIDYTLDGREFTALNGGPVFTPTPAFSLMVTCRDQAEVDGFWDRLCEGGQPSQCGWLSDRWGYSWQIVPEAFGRMMREGEPAGRQRAFKAMMRMQKLDMAALQAAYDDDPA